MATINISDLNPTGTELFSDSESFMNELVDGELQIINGGIVPLLAIPAAILAGGAIAAHLYVSYKAVRRLIN